MLFARCLKGSIGTKHGGGAEKERDVLSLNYDLRGKTCVRGTATSLFGVASGGVELTQGGLFPVSANPPHCLTRTYRKEGIRVSRSQS